MSYFKKGQKMNVLQIENAPKDKKAFMERLTADGFKFVTKPKSKQVCVEVNVDFETEDFAQLEKFFLIQNESL